MPGEARAGGRAAAEPTVVAAPTTAGPTVVAGPTTAGRAVERTADARLARLHLRGGMLSLARAELEQMAGVSELDREALADLAEARWRSGELVRAAEAAEAHLAAGGTEPLAQLICAEGAERQGRLADAERHAEAVLDRVGLGIEQLFAGEARSTAWPEPDVGWMDVGASEPGRWNLLVGGVEVADPNPGTWTAAPEARMSIPPAASGSRGGPNSAAATQDDRTEATETADRELATASLELAARHVRPVPSRLALVLRLDPAFAASVIELADGALPAAAHDPPTAAALHIVRGDAYRGLGYETEAVAAYHLALRVLTARITEETT